MGIANSKKLIELASQCKEEDAILMLNDAYMIDPNYTNTDGDSALHFAASNNLIELTYKLLSFDVEINKKNKFSSCPLHIATRMGHNQIVRLLLKAATCNVNLESCSSYNALTIAASCNNLSIARLLLENNAHIQDVTLIFASLHRNGEEMCRILLNHGANVNATDEYGNTALMQSAALCHEKVVNVLVSREWSPIIQINKQNQYGWSALHFAYSAYVLDKNGTNTNQMAKHNIINILLKKGANISLNNNDGKKPKDVSPQKFDLDEIQNQQSQEIDGVPARKKRKFEDDRSDKINKNLAMEFDIEADNNEIKESKDELSELDRVELAEDPYDNYSPPKPRKNKKRGRQNGANGAPLRRSVRNMNRRK